MIKSKIIQSILIFATCMLITGNVLAMDWPRFLGPDRNSTSPETGILRTWPEAGPIMLWAVNVGKGYGGPAIKDGKVYLLDRDDNTGDILRCFDLETGEELWSFSYDAPGSYSFPGSRTVPTVDENYVYICGPFGQLHCIDINTHQPVWKRNIWTDFGGEDIPMWAITQSPLVYGDLLIIAAQTPEAGVVAFNKITGELVWKTPPLGNVGYVSPALVKIDDKDQVVMITASASRSGQETGNVIGIDPLAGSILWKYDQWRCDIPVPCAYDAGDNKILVVGGYELGATMLEIEKKADGTFGVNELFVTREFGDQTKPPIMHDGYFYGQYGTNNRRDGLVCMSMDGEVMWRTRRNPDFNKGSMILVDGLIIATDGANGLYLIEPSHEAYKPIASVEFLKLGGVDGSNPMTNFGGSTQNWAPIALSQGKLLIRDQNQMYCIKVVE
jgi:outer membrane protein assembly factor BamB